LPAAVCGPAHMAEILFRALPHGRFPGEKGRGKVTLSEAMERFIISQRAVGHSPKTVLAYQNRFKTFLQYEEITAVMDIGEITPELLDRYGQWLRQDRMLYQGHGHYHPARPGKFSQTSVFGRIQAVKTLFKFCSDRGYLPANPARSLKQKRPSDSAREKLMRREDLYRMLDVAVKQAEEGWPRDLAILMFIVDTAARRGEVATLRLPNLNLGRLEAAVYGKTGERELDFTSKTAEVLGWWLVQRPEVGHDFVFTNQGKGHPHLVGRPLTPGGLDQVFKRLGRRAGVKGAFNPHSIRHLIGQTMTDHANLEIARQKLGHQDVTTTARFYAHQDRSRVKAATVMYSPLANYRHDGLEKGHGDDLAAF
jgi:site-specific recombinase XerD